MHPALLAKNTNRRGWFSTIEIIIKVAYWYKRDKWNFQYKKKLTQTIWYKEVNCTEPSPSVRLSQLGLVRQGDRLANSIYMCNSFYSIVDPGSWGIQNSKTKIFSWTNFEGSFKFYPSQSKTKFKNCQHYTGYYFRIDNGKARFEKCK